MKKLLGLALQILQKPAIDFAVGGQAVLEGVMMRSPGHYTVSVRDPEGKIQMKQARFQSVMEKHRFLKLPLIRGMVHLVESMSIGMKCLNYSNAIFLGEDEATEEQKKADRSPLMKALFGVGAVLYFLLTLGFALLLLKAAPLWIANLLSARFPSIHDHYLLFNLIDGVAKITIFLAYIVSISWLSDIRRVFEYHGAEHKSIWAYEKGLSLTVKSAAAQTRFHPRCGTSFIMIVILMSILVYTVIPPAEHFAVQLGTRILVIPLIAGLSYELLKLSAKWQGQWWVKALSTPGLWVQRLTTREPDEKQLEIALHSLKASLKAEGVS